MRRSVWGPLVLVVAVVVAVGIAGYGAYQLGLERGLAETADLGPGVVVHPWVGGYWAFGWFGLMFRLLFFFLILGFVTRFVFGRRRWGWNGGHHHHGPDGSHHPMESRLAEWHERAHAPSPESDPSD